MTGTGIFTPETWGMAFCIILILCALFGIISWACDELDED